MTADDAHVLLDAVGALRSDIAAGREPWREYTGGPDDPKTTRDGYVTALDRIAGRLETAVGTTVSPWKEDARTRFNRKGRRLNLATRAVAQVERWTS